MHTIVVISVILSFLASSGVAIRFVYKSVRKFGDVADAMPTLLAIADEFKPNGGGSLRDAVDNLNRKTIEVKKDLTTSNDQIQRNLVEVHTKNLKEINARHIETTQILSDKIEEAATGLKNQLDEHGVLDDARFSKHDEQFNKLFKLGEVIQNMSDKLTTHISDEEKQLKDINQSIQSTDK